MLSRNILQAILIAAAGYMASGCAVVGARGPYNGLSNHAERMVICTKNPDYGAMTRLDYGTCMRQANSCLTQVRQQIVGVGESIVSMAETGAETGAIGLSTSGIPGVGALSGAANGANAGALIHSQARSSATGNCTNQNLQDARTRRPGVHATSALVRTTNQPGVIPDWTVPDNAPPTEASEQDEPNR